MNALICTFLWQFFDKSMAIGKFMASLWQVRGSLWQCFYTGAGEYVDYHLAAEPAPAPF